MRGLETIINALAIVIGGVLGILFKRFLKERYQDTIIKATGFSVVFLGAAGTLSKILTVRPDGTLSTGGSMVMILSLALGALLGELIDLDAQFERFGEWLKHKTGSDGDFMKKKLSVIAVIILVLAICVSAWFYGYYNHKSNDNLPTLAAIAEMSEADVNSLLPGYHIDQLREVWGKPDTSENGTACWKIGNDTILVVSYKNNGIVAICGLKDDSGT